MKDEQQEGRNVELLPGAHEVLELLSVCGVVPLEQLTIKATQWVGSGSATHEPPFARVDVFFRGGHSLAVTGVTVVRDKGRGKDVAPRGSKPGQSSE